MTSLFPDEPEIGTYKSPQSPQATAIAEGRQLAREGAETALGGSPAAFAAIAMAALKLAAERNEYLTTDDIKPLCSMTPPEPMAWGAICLQAARAGLIEATDRTVKTANRMAHARDQRVWRSLVFSGVRP